MCSASERYICANKLNNMIKLYKRPFSKTLSFSTLSGLLVFIFSLFIFGRYILLPCLQCGDWASWAALGLISIFMLAVWYSYIGMCFYIILEDDKITVQNHLLPFLKISRNYKELGSIRFWPPPPGNWSVEAVEMVRKGKKRDFAIIRYYSRQKIYQVTSRKGTCIQKLASGNQRWLQDRDLVLSCTRYARL